MEKSLCHYVEKLGLVWLDCSEHFAFKSFAKKNMFISEYMNL